MDIRSMTGVPDEKMLKEILFLHKRIFGSKSEELRNELEKKHNVLITVAYNGDSLVGYKIGYDQKITIYIVG